jgi:hypothetical protein
MLLSSASITFCASFNPFSSRRQMTLNIFAWRCLIQLKLKYVREIGGTDLVSEPKRKDQDYVSVARCNKLEEKKKRDVMSCILGTFNLGSLYPR